MLTILSRKAVVSVFLDSLKFVELVFAEALGAELVHPKSETDKHEKAENCRRDLRV